MSKVIIKLNQEGKGCGYVFLKGDIFRSGGEKAHAAEFEKKFYSKKNGAFYLKLVNAKDNKYYMDVRAATSRVEPVKHF
ncbi:hypothetical protein ACJJIF_09775 [Microbulbifer sp. SSSA002]|uniref:hypothetical protein n=1 Tax=Microbulbifer sp. SSSA002 TaxID=3243376 RepID=UPI00403A729D